MNQPKMRRSPLPRVRSRSSAILAPAMVAHDVSGWFATLGLVVDSALGFLFATFDQAEHNGANGGLGAVCRVQLGQDSGYLVLDGANRQSNLRADFTVGPARCQQPQDVTLAIAQALQLRRRGDA